MPHLTVRWVGPAAYLTCDGSFAGYDARSGVYNECMALALSVYRSI